MASGFSYLYSVLKRGEGEVAGQSTDLNLKGCAGIGWGEFGQPCYSGPLSANNTTASGECIQSEALNVDTPTVGLSLTGETVEPFLVKLGLFPVSPDVCQRIKMFICITGKLRQNRFFKIQRKSRHCIYSKYPERCK